MNLADDRQSFYEFFGMSSRHCERLRGVVEGPKGSLVFPSDVEGHFHGLYVEGYLRHFGSPEDDTPMLPRIYLNHFDARLSKAARKRFRDRGYCENGAQQHRDIVLELTVVPAELDQWAVWLWSFIFARENNRPSYLEPTPFPIEGQNRDWMATRYEWSQAAHEQYEVWRQQQERRRNDRVAGTVGGI